MSKLSNPLIISQNFFFAFCKKNNWRSSGQCSPRSMLKLSIHLVILQKYFVAFCKKNYFAHPVKTYCQRNFLCTPWPFDKEKDDVNIFNSKWDLTTPTINNSTKMYKALLLDLNEMNDYKNRLRSEVVGMK